MHLLKLVRKCLANRERGSILNNIQMVIDNAICTGCGACSGICPTQAISMTINLAGYLKPNIEYSKCTYCGMCYDVCPSVFENTPCFNTEDIFHGKYLEGYIGYATNNEIRQKAQSGGIVTALLCYLIEKKIIDGAIVNKFSMATKRPEAVYESKKAGIIDASGSYYSQSAVVEHILKHQDKKTAAVVLGCQAESIKLIREKYAQFSLPEYTIGLFCAGQYSGKYIDELINKANCDKDKVVKFRFRDKDAGGWPGNTKIYTDNGNFILDKKNRHLLKPVFELFRCLLCFDQMNVFSDIAVGDPWGINLDSSKKGSTVIITRTNKGKELIRAAQKDGIISINRLDVKEIITGQKVDTRLKTQFFTAMEICKEKGYLLPVNEKCFENIVYKEPTTKELKRIRERIDYSRKIFLVSDVEKYKNFVTKKKREIRRERVIRNIIGFPKRCMKYLFRKIKNKFRDK